MKIKLLTGIFVILLSACADLPRDVVKLAVLKEEIILECSEFTFLSSDDIEFKEKDGYFIAEITKLDHVYFLCYFDKHLNNYSYITMGKLYGGGKYFEKENDKLHENILELQVKLNEKNFYIREVYSNGKIRVILYDSRSTYCIVQLPEMLEHFNNLDSLELKTCIANDRCVLWDDLRNIGWEK